MIATRPEAAEGTMRECEALGIDHVWMHRSVGAGSVSAAATDYGRQHGITVIDGGCPLMFAPASDFGHRVMRLMFSLNGNVPARSRCPGGGCPGPCDHRPWCARTGGWVN